LKLSRTGTHANFIKDDNFAKAYATLEDRTPVLVDSVKIGDNTFMGAGGGGRSCVKDLLVLYKSFIGAINDAFGVSQEKGSSSPFKQVKHLISAHIPFDEPSFRETSYAQGWCRAQLPARIGQTGLNPLVLPTMPIVGKGSPSRLVIYHSGSLVGSLTAVNLFPETHSAIVVLTNSLELNDCRLDWSADN
jgi:hypothetical protein